MAANYKAKIPATCLIAGIRFYRLAISLLLGVRCRFEPSCSSYAMEAITKHGALQGCLLLIKRLLRCHPWHEGGIDPVPDSIVKNRK